MAQLFDIVTLSDKITARRAPVLKKYYLRHGNELVKRKNPLGDRLADPVSVILGGVSVISQILPNLFGAERATAQDFQTLFPGGGLITAQFRKYLEQRIKYKKDIPRDLQMYSVQFVIDNNSSVCPQTYTFQNPPGTNPGGEANGGWNPCLEKFYAILRQEATGGGQQIYPNIYGTNWQAYLPYILGGGALLLLLNANKRRK